MGEKLMLPMLEMEKLSKARYVWSFIVIINFKYKIIRSLFLLIRYEHKIALLHIYDLFIINFSI